MSNAELRTREDLVSFLADWPGYCDMHPHNGSTAHEIVGNIIMNISNESKFDSFQLIDRGLLKNRLKICQNLTRMAPVV